MSETTEEKPFDISEEDCEVCEDAEAQLVVDGKFMCVDCATDYLKSLEDDEEEEGEESVSENEPVEEVNNEPKDRVIERESESEKEDPEDEEDEESEDVEKE